MKSRPILFSAPMIRALLDGSKTQTRRVIKDIPWKAGVNRSFSQAVPFNNGPIWHIAGGEEMTTGFKCRYGQPGDFLWVRETHYLHDDMKGIAYAADNASLPKGCRVAGFSKAIPSIHMKRKFSRLTLRITDVRAQRLEDIRDHDAEAEGCFFTDYGRQCFHQNKPPCDPGDCPAPHSTHPQRNGWMWDATSSPDQCLSTARSAFLNLWEHVNGEGSSHLNPWVWALAFDVHKCNVADIRQKMAA